MDHAREVKAELEALSGVSIPVRTSEAGKLFGSVTVEDIAAAVKKANGRSLEKKSIKLSKGQIKSTGMYSVEVKLHSDVVANLNFEVVAE